MTKPGRKSARSYVTGLFRRVGSNSKSSSDGNVSARKQRRKTDSFDHIINKETATQDELITETSPPPPSSYQRFEPETYDGGTRVCRVCLSVKDRDEFPEVQTCAHRTCVDCLQEYFRTEIWESRIVIKCPECTEPIDTNRIHAILMNDRSTRDKYERFLLRRALITDKDARWCPAPDCGYCVIATGCEKCPVLKCNRPGCGTLFCYHCRRKWHPNRKCYDMREELLHYQDFNSDYAIEDMCDKEEQYVGRVGEMKPCPRCNFLILKSYDGSCNEMVCSVCKTKFCWQCMREITKYHFFSMSGCTYYGRYPWSRKRRILYQIGILFGAPLALGLAVVIAVPTLIVGIPVWVGTKVFYRYKGRISRHKCNLVTVASVAGSIVVSPVIAGLAVGFATPSLLGYVYGLVPFSLLCTCVTSRSQSPVPLPLLYDQTTNANVMLTEL